MIAVMITSVVRRDVLLPEVISYFQILGGYSSLLVSQLLILDAVVSFISLF